MGLRGLSWTPRSFFDPQIQKGEGHVIERETDHQSDAGSDRINLERYGADRAGRVFVAHILYPICVRSADGGSRDVVWYFGRASAVFGDGYCVRGTLETLSWSGFVIFFRRAGVSQQVKSIQIRPHRQVHRGLGESPLLLGLSGTDGRRDGAGRRLRAGPGLAGHFQPSRAKPSLHDRFLGPLFIWRGVHLFPWCKRHDGR